MSEKSYEDDRVMPQNYEGRIPSQLVAIRGPEEVTTKDVEAGIEKR